MRDCYVIIENSEKIGFGFGVMYITTVVSSGPYVRSTWFNSSTVYSTMICTIKVLFSKKS